MRKGSMKGRIKQKPVEHINFIQNVYLNIQGLEPLNFQAITDQAENLGSNPP
ncbi:hypothetical protein QQ008_26920 [Fulvivirgaceae bacterium BMA10]|uniref:Uncharacterized protein n=1 Tax=Splendidivirga corallicola TaxID=3051826 RepID=A0ABT8KW85_9BACT|nr:hypothetical protein [Fulvivirgaceae bacterium BMA10]